MQQAVQQLWSSNGKFIKSVHRSRDDIQPFAELMYAGGMYESIQQSGAPSVITISAKTAAKVNASLYGIWM